MPDKQLYLVKPRQKRNREHPPTPLGSLLNKYNISLSRVQNWLVNEGETINSTSTLSRLVNQKCGADFAGRLNSLIAKNLRIYLLGEGYSQAEIDMELSAVFTEGEYTPMISRRVKLSDAACRHFNFKGNYSGEIVFLDPFIKPPETHGEVFFPARLREVYDAVIDAIKYRHFIAVLGPIGSGKTTLRAMIEEFGAANGDIRLVWPEFADQGRVTPMEIAKEILLECDIEKPPGRSATLMRKLKSTLAAITNTGQRAALLFDEAHRMNTVALRSLKNFFEMSSGGFQKYLGVILFGWPKLETNLADSEFQEIYERIHFIAMPDFSDLAADYLRHRLGLVGADLDKLFDKKAIDLVCNMAETPLSIGNIANRALNIAFANNEKRVAGAQLAADDFFKTEQQGFKKR